MIVVCIDDIYLVDNVEIKSSLLTKYQKYKVVYEHDFTYQIIDNKNHNDSYIKERFITIKELREKKLKRILK